MVSLLALLLHGRGSTPGPRGAEELGRGMQRLARAGAREVRRRDRGDVGPPRAERRALARFAWRLVEVWSLRLEGGSHE